MKTLLTIIAVSAISTSAWAQVTVPARPRPQAPPAAPVVPTPVTPRTPVMPAMPMTPALLEPWLADVVTIDSDAVQDAWLQSRLAMEEAGRHLEDLHVDMPFVADLQSSGVFIGGNAYESGLSLLSRRDYERAIARFDQVIGQKAERADAALYHKAYALYRLGRSTEATTALAQLKKEHPSSAYLKDASVLESAVRQSAGQPINPDQADDDELKLLALNALQHTDPERALPLLESVLNGANSLQLKQRAIFVLAQSSQPRARDILMGLARGGGNPDLQRYAIRYVATGGKRGATSAELRQIYDSTQDVDVKKAVIQAWGRSGDMAALLSVVTAPSGNLELKRSAVSQIDETSAINDLWAVYQKETNSDLKMSILARLGSLGAADRLGDVIRSESDPEIRRRAIRSLGSMRPDKSGTMLADLYARESDADNKKAIISALASQNNGESLVAIARKETNMNLKREIVTRLSTMTRNKAAMDYMLEIIK